MPTLPYNSPDEANDPKPDDQSNDPGMSSGVRIGITEIPSTRAEVTLEVARWRNPIIQRLRSWGSCCQHQLRKETTGISDVYGNPQTIELLTVKSY